ncbi:MAG: outer rane transport energization protein TonB [Hymenobacter sp.]|nr:outer rane transport energization protein TonB [Hymenobacter sp.]
MKHCFLIIPATIMLLSGNQLVYAQQPATPAEPVYAVVDKMPRFRSGDSTTVALLNYLGQNTRYPVGALQDRATGRVFVSFVVNRTGRVEQVKMAKPGHPALNTEALRVVSEMPRWEVPGQKAGQPVSVSFTVPITFNMRTATPADIQAMQGKRRAAVQKQLDDAQAQLASPTAAGHEAAAVFLADPLGATHYIARQVQYPLDASRAQQQGTVLVDFVVGSDGKVTDVRVAKGVFPSLDSEALRVVSGMPAWQPATREGQPVAMPLTGVPVTFRLK